MTRGAAWYRPAVPRAPAPGLRDALLRVEASCDVAARRAADPVRFVHRYADPLEQELVGLLASAFAFGNVKAIGKKVEEALERLGPGLLAVTASRPELARRLRGFVHRLYRGPDVGALLLGARRVQLDEGSLGAALEVRLARHGALRPALADWVTTVRAAGGLDRRRTRGADHLLASPAGASACKRLLLYLRWMCRPADGVDLGLWRIPPRVLLVPLDVHVHRLSRNVGLTRRASASWAAAEEVTRGLARFDPEDPTRFDFPLCHLGMVSDCPSRRDPSRCEGCGVRPVCVHWSRTRG